MLSRRAAVVLAEDGDQKRLVLVISAMRSRCVPILLSSYTFLTVTVWEQMKIDGVWRASFIFLAGQNRSRGGRGRAAKTNQIILIERP